MNDTQSAIVQLVEEAVERQVIRVAAGELPRMTIEAEETLIAAQEPIYRRSQFLVRPTVEEVEASDGRKTHIAQFARIEPAWLRLALAKAARWEKFNVRTKSWVACDPTHDVTATLLAKYGEWRFPSVVGVTTTPTLRPDGTIFSTEGYDPRTRLILMAPPKLPNVDPTPDNAARALKFLDELLSEFPFADAASRSVALSALITPVCRAAYSVAPMHVAKAPESGSGKSYLWDLAAAIVSGEFMPVMAAGRTEEETEKRLGAALLSGQPLISIDNLNGTLFGDALCQAIERPLCDIRILGKSEKVRIEARGVTFFATGNNISLTGDMPRRAIVATIDPQIERPELRKFQQDPFSMVIADRGKYIGAALCVVRSHIVAGYPGKVPPLGSFGGWSNCVRSALIWLGCADPCETMETARAEDPRRAELTAVLTSWTEVFGAGFPKRQTVSVVLTAIEEKTTLSTSDSTHDGHESAYLHPELREAILAVAAPQGRISAKSLGWWIKRNKGRVTDGLRFNGGADRHCRAAEWYVESIQEPAP